MMADVIAMLRSRPFIFFICFFLSFLIHAGALFFSESSSGSSHKSIVKTLGSRIDLRILQAEDLQKYNNEKIVKKRPEKSDEVFDQRQFSSNKVNSARLVGKLKVDYPKLSRLLREEGIVTLFVTVSRDGEVRKVNVKKSSGSPRLDQRARREVLEAKFRPSYQIRDDKKLYFEDKLYIDVRFKLID